MVVLKKKDVNFQEWAVDKYQELVKLLNVSGEDGQIDPLSLNKALLGFSQNFSWAIIMHEIEANKHEVLSHQFELWYNDRYNEAERSIKDSEPGKRATKDMLEAKVTQLFHDEYNAKKIELIDQYNRAELLKGLVKVLDRQASLLQAISANMRSELYFSGGVPMSPSHGKENDRAKSFLKRAMNSVGSVDSEE